tara:strand:- start:290 stop:1258 length:969 start_codon:yes stop_codon:yes gene_type:complete
MKTFANFSAIDLFAGIGGFRIAIEENDGECVMASEIDKWARKTYAANFGETPRGDITQIKTMDIPDVDLITAGFPCQSFSSIGLRKGFEDEKKGTLFWEIIRIAKAKQPQMLLLENVRGLLSINKGATMKTILHSLEEIGYTVFYEVLNSKDFLVPQSRPRLFFACFRDDIAPPSFKFPTPTGSIGIGQFIESDAKGYDVSEKLQNGSLLRRGVAALDAACVDSASTAPIRCLCSSYHKVQLMTSSFVRDGKTGLRLLTSGECLAAQGFPTDFILPCSRTQTYIQLGNSVTVPVVSSILKNMLAARSQVAVQEQVAKRRRTH